MSDLEPTTRAMTRVRATMHALREFDLQSTSVAALAGSLKLFDGRATSRAFEPFDALEVEVTRALAARICRQGDDPPGDAALDRLVRFIEDYVSRLPESQAATFRHLLVVFEYQPMVFGPKRRRFSRLDGDAQDENLNRWATAPQAARVAAFNGIKTICMLGWYSDPSTWDAIGYDGPTLDDLPRPDDLEPGDTP